MKRWIWMLVLMLLLCGCTGGQKEASRDVYAMDTVMNLHVWGADPDKALDTAERTIREIEGTWSAHDPDSVLSMLNRGENASEAAQAFLAQVEELSVLTGGAFDPHLGAVSALWDFSGESRAVPDGDAVAAALAVRQWDLGAVVKGFAGQQAAQAMLAEDSGAAYGILNLGGNVQTFGSKPDGSPWRIAIRNPRGDGTVGILELEGTVSVITSGDYQRYFEIDGVRYHHILDPETGYPARSGVASVTVVCGDGMRGDALSTALFVLGLEQGSALWRSCRDFEAVFLLENGEIYATSGLELDGCDYRVIE